MSESLVSADASPCTQCGACCAAYRVSFYWAEADVLGLGEQHYERLSPLLACLRGTAAEPVRCATLDGEIGKAVRCGIYAQRPSPCREVQVGDDRCRRARARHGLAPCD